MVKRICVVSLWWASAAQAGTSFIELVPDRPGPYEPGASVDVEVLFHNSVGQEIQPRLITFDFSVTDPTLDLPSTFSFDNICGFSDCPYSRFESMPSVSVVYPRSEPPPPGFIVMIPDGTSYEFGTLRVGLPDVVGTFVLDAMNRSAPDTNTGARFDYGFDERVILHWLNGNLAGG